MAQKLVSLLTPCYNMEKYIYRLLDSVLAQTYPCVEMIVVDDGSKDGSARVIETYIPRFEQRGYTLRYVYQSNSGQSVAIQNGLKLVSGDYLAWPDADDFYASPSSIQRMVDALESASVDFAMVRTLERVVDEHSLRELWIIGENAHEKESDSLFEDCLLQQNGFFYIPGAYMVRFSALRETTDLQIYTEKNAGQNWQLFLPILYSYRCLTVKEPLYCVLNRSSSHSRGQYNGYEGIMTRYDSYEATIQGTLDRIKNMSEGERTRYKKLVKGNYQKLKMKAAFDYNKREDFFLFYTSLSPSMLTKKEKCLYFCFLFHLVPISRWGYCKIKQIAK